MLGSPGGAGSERRQRRRGEPSPSATSPRSPAASSADGGPACSFKTPVSIPAPARRLPGGPSHRRPEVPGHRSDRLPRLALARPARRARPRGGRRPPARAARTAPRRERARRRCASMPATPAIRDLIAGCDAVLHFAGVPDPAARRCRPGGGGARERRHDPQPARGLPRARRRADLPSSVRAAIDPPPDAYAISKRLGEEVCAAAPRPGDRGSPDLGLRPGPGRAGGRDRGDRLLRRPGARRRADRDPRRPRPRARLRLRRRRRAGRWSGSPPRRRWNETVTIASGVSTPLSRAAELVRDAAGSSAPIETPGGVLAAGGE